MRIPRHQMWMEVSNVIAKRSTCYRANVGCVITHKGRSISTGYNGPPAGESHCDGEACELHISGRCMRAIHAEENAINFMKSEYSSSEALFKQSILYCEFSPCSECGNLILKNSIPIIVFRHTYDDDVVRKLIQKGIRVYRCTTAGMLIDEKTKAFVDNIEFNW